MVPNKGRKERGLHEPRSPLWFSAIIWWWRFAIFAGSALPVSKSAGWPKGGVEGCSWTETALVCCLSELTAEFHHVFLSFSCVEGVWVAQMYGRSRLDVQIRYVHWGACELTVGQITVTAEAGAARSPTHFSPLFLKGVAHFPISRHRFRFWTL